MAGSLTVVQRRAVLHVGPHKTASTYLQCRLMLARDALAAHGFAYPEEGIAQFAHHQLYFFLHEPTQASSAVTEAGLTRALATQPNVILSSENFVYLSIPELRRLRALLVDFRVEVVIYLRSPVQLWPSHWQELVRQGRDVTFLDYLGACCGWTDVLLPDAVNPVAQIAKLAAGFNVERLRILCLENVLATGVDPFAHFWRDVLDLPGPVPLHDVPPLNPSMSAERIELLRNLNARYRASHGTDPRQAVMHAYFTRREEVEAQPRFQDFAAAFHASARPITLRSNQELIRHRERVLLGRFGARIENRAAADRIWPETLLESRTPSAERYWPDRLGFIEFIEETGRLLET